jgi:hypothetical protein
MLMRSICVLFTSSLLFAQSYSPVHFGVAEGPNNNVFPFGNTTVPFRYSQIHDDVPTMVITGMAFRHNYTSTATYPVHSITIDAWMSTAVTPAAGAVTTFDSNHGLDKIQVVFNRTYTLGASDSSDLPGQFVLDYPLDVPFVFPGAGASLCWEVHVTAKTQNGSIVYDAAAGTATSAANPPVAIGRFGTGCVATGQTNPMTAVGAQSIDWAAPTATMTVNGSNLLPNGVHLFCTGLDSGLFSGIPLPATLPGSNCNVYADILLSPVVIADAAGAGSNALTFVPQPSFHGITLFSQIWALDPPVGAFGIATSNAAMHHIVAPFTVPQPVTRIYSSANLNPTGTVATNYGLVTKFY